jgi:hypothetical protein
VVAVTPPAPSRSSGCSTASGTPDRRLRRIFDDRIEVRRRAGDHRHGSTPSTRSGALYRLPPPDRRPARPGIPLLVAEDCCRTPLPGDLAAPGQPPGGACGVQRLVGILALAARADCEQARAYRWAASPPGDPHHPTLEQRFGPAHDHTGDPAGQHPLSLCNNLRPPASRGAALT